MKITCCIPNNLNKDSCYNGDLQKGCTTLPFPYSTNIKNTISKTVVIQAYR